MAVLYGLDANRRLVHLVTIGGASFDEWRAAVLGDFCGLMQDDYAGRRPLQ
jgi:hypothetical protein